MQMIRIVDYWQGPPFQLDRSSVVDIWKVGQANPDANISFVDDTDNNLGGDAVVLFYGEGDTEEIKKALITMLGRM